MSFNENNPPTSSLLISGDMRANFLATRRHMYSINWLGDPLFECWPDDDATVPTTWNLSGTGAAIARVTTAVDIAVGSMSARVTYGSAVAFLSQFIFPTASYDDFFDGRVFTAGCFVKTSTAGIARILLTDGVTSTSSSFHTGGGAFEFLDLEHTMDAASTLSQFQCRVEGAGNAIFSGPVVLFSDIKPDRFVFPGTIRSSLVHGIRGDAFLGFVDQFVPQRPFIIEHVQLISRTAPSPTALIWDVNQWDGAAFTSMFTSGGRPRITSGATAGGSAPDGTYNRRCFSSYFGAPALSPGVILRTEVDQLPTTPGTDVNAFIRYKTWARPQELILAYNAVR